MPTTIEWTDETWNPVPSDPQYAVNVLGWIRGPSGRILKSQYKGNNILDTVATVSSMLLPLRKGGCSLPGRLDFSVVAAAEAGHPVIQTGGKQDAPRN